ncbi:MAG: FtsQ-type POTRA domain-containing protein [Bryobacterales bacterium]
MPSSPKTKRQDASGESEAYRRRKRPVRVRSWVFDWRNWPWQPIFFTLAFIGLGATSVYAVNRYLGDGPRFRLAESGLAVSGVDRLDESSIRGIFSEDLGLSLADIPVEERRASLLEIPWIAEASVARLWPDRIWVHIRERQPVAFVRVPGSSGGLRARLIDTEGVFLDPIKNVRFELPVLDGIPADLPAPSRKERVALYLRLMNALENEEPRYGSQVSQVDVADPHNAKVTVAHNGDVVTLDLGDELFRHRFETFLKYIETWKRQFGAVGSIDLRYEDQVVVVPPVSREGGAQRN